jgi:signal transduction histidine kinase
MAIPVDPTARLHAELQSLQRRLGRAERLAALGALAATLAHELGTPLHSIAGHLDLMRTDPSLPGALKERTEIVAGEVDRLCELIRHHLKRLRSPLPAPAPNDVTALVSRIVRVMEPTCAAKRVRVQLDLDEAAAAPFACDGRQVEQVLMNLMQNAFDAMPDGGRLTIRTTHLESGRAISVCDDGQGIPPDVIDRVFEPFFTTKGADHGTGLGLSLCREIARNHGGDVALDSRPGEGTVVTLTLGTPPHAERA